MKDKLGHGSNRHGRGGTNGEGSSHPNHPMSKGGLMAMAHVANRAAQTKAHQEILKAIAKSHGGSITVASRAHSGGAARKTFSK